MKNKILNITCSTFDVSDTIPNSILVTNVNQDLSGDEYHTSLGDLTPSEIIKVVPAFNEIKFYPNGFDQTSSVYFETVILLTSLSHRIKVSNFDAGIVKNFTDIDVVSRDPEPTLWVFGCSHSHGVGLTLPEQRYSNILQKHLGLPLKSITMPGSSIQWSFRHLINANIQPGDTVIWQLTTPDRLTWADPSPTEIMLSKTKKKDLVNVWNDSQSLFHTLSILNAGVQYLRSKSVKFAITSILNLQSLFYQYLVEYVKYPEFCYTPDWLKDLGTDNLHAGPLSHQALAQALVDHLQYYNE